ncbi:MAG: urate hydroxylase PuuD [Actinobacteria bacterium]|nr:urate hydroxylase PuuD [Actinomycetota bacterium]
MDADYLKDVADLCLRLLHVVAGIAWIGASFYFIRLDLGLSPPYERADRERGVAGEYWGVHGGGFYHSQKYRVAPRALPEPLHWFKWEAYTTWLSGFALLVLLYWADAKTRLVDPSVADLEAWQAVALSAGLLAGGWLVYDVACRLLRDDVSVAVTTALLVVGVAWASGELFAARASYLQVGAVLGTIMAANVFLVIIPAHRELVRAKLEGREPDPAPGLRAKQRSVHNNYLTLPVVFTMLAGHAPLTFGSDRAWLVLLAIFAILVVVRHFFNLVHRGRMPLWLLGAAAAGAVALAIVLEPDEERRAGVPPTDERAVEIVSERCQACHSGAAAPLGVRLETAEQLRANAAAIHRQVTRNAMPPGNVTAMTDAERDTLAAWAAAAR